MTKPSAVDAVQDIEVPTEITFKMASSPVSKLPRSAQTEVKVARVIPSKVVKRKPYKPRKTSQPAKLLMKFRKPSFPSGKSKSDDECRHSDSLFSDDESDSSLSESGQKAPKVLSLSLSNLTV